MGIKAKSSKVHEVMVTLTLWIKRLKKRSNPSLGHGCAARDHLQLPQDLNCAGLYTLALRLQIGQSDVIAEYEKLAKWPTKTIRGSSSKTTVHGAAKSQGEMVCG